MNRSDLPGKTPRTSPKNGSTPQKIPVTPTGVRLIKVKPGQIEVLAALMRGMTLAEVAVSMNVTEGALRMRLRDLRLITGAVSPIHLACIFIAAQVISVSSDGTVLVHLSEQPRRKSKLA